MQRPRNRGALSCACVAIAVMLTGLIAGSCGGGGGGSGGGGTGLITVRVSDPPICEAPAGPFNNIWVTVTKVRAHLSSGAGSNDSGWVDLVDLTANPVQIDLLSQGSTECFLAALGSTTGLPAGDYQQIRIHLLSNTPGAGEATPSPNQCAGTGGYNCIDHQTTGLELLLLSSQANTGIKIPPGQIAGGGIILLEGQAADINIDFDGCRSVHQQGNGAWRLKPTVHAGVVSLNNSAISGRVVDSLTGAPIAAGTILVLAERPDLGGVNRVIAQALANPADGMFLICPLSAGDYDLVVAASTGAGAVYGPTVLFSVPVGTNVGDIPLVLTGGASTAPATLTGLVTSADAASMPTASDIAVTALQFATPNGSAAILVTIPVFPGSISDVTTAPGGACPANTACSTWTLIVPASNPSVGTFLPGGTTFSIPAAAPVLYTIDAQAFAPGGLATPNCVPSRLATAFDVAAMPLAATPGLPTTAATLAFTSCAAGF